MKKSLSVALIILALVNIFAICATTVSFAGDTLAELPLVPENIAAVNSSTGVSITWEQSEYAAGYKIYRSEDGNEYTQIGDVRGVSENSFTDTGTVSGTEYTYKIKAYNAFEESEFSEERAVVYLRQPTLTTVSSACGGIKLVWKKSDGAEGYTVYRKSGNRDTVVAQLSGDTVNTYLDRNVKNNKSYKYTVVAQSGIYRSSFAYRTSGVYITAPIPERIKVCDGCIKFYWKQTETADKYRIYRKNDNGEWIRLATVGKAFSFYKDTSVENGKKYTYTVRAIDGDCISGYDTEGLSTKYVAAPQKVTAENHCSDTIRVKWSKVSGTKEYIIYRKDSKNKEWVEVARTVSCQYEDSKISNGREYTYSVRTKAKSGAKSAYSVQVKVTALKQPSKIKLQSTADGVKIKWTKMSSATGYKVYRRLKGEDSWTYIKKIKSGSTTSCTDSNVKNGKTYFYTVKQVKGSESGSYNKSGVSVKYVSPPKLSVTHSPKGAVLKWNESKIGTGYIVERKSQGEKEWKTLVVISSNAKTSYTDKNPVYGKKNSYRVQLRNDGAVSNVCSLYGINPKKKMVALTYDDGPYTPVTNKILDTLEKYGGRATFFVVGSRVSSYKDCIKREADLGCEIGNHTYNHTILTSVSASTIVSEISKTNDAVKKITGESPKIVRAPGGSVNSTVKNNVKYPLFNWSVDTLDWKNRNSSSVVSNIKNNVRDGSIILMHDLYTSTGDASEEIIPWLVNKGYQLVTVSELMAVKGIDVKNGELYTRGY